MVPSRLLSIATLSASLGASLGCAPGNPGMNVLGAIPPDSEDGCTVDPASAVFEGRHVFDLDPRFNPTMELSLSMQNHLINRYSVTFPVMANQNDITITGAEVELVDRNGRRLAIQNAFYRTPGLGTIPAASGDQAGRGIANVEVIPPNVVTQLSALFADVPAGASEIVARVAVIGSTQGGSEVISGDYVAPISLCVGCRYIPGVPPESPTPSMPADGCRVGQDLRYVGGTPPLVACETGDTCPSDLCVLGRCLP